METVFLANPILPKVTTGYIAADKPAIYFT